MPDVWLRAPAGMFPAREDADDHDLSPCYVRLRDYRALLDRAERAEAERNAAFAAGQEDMRERAAKALAGIALAMSMASTHPDADPERAQALVGIYRELAEAIRALPIQPRP